MFFNKKNVIEDMNLSPSKKLVINFLEKEKIPYSLIVEDTHLPIYDEHTGDILGEKIPSLKLKVSSFDFIKSREFVDFLKKEGRKELVCNSSEEILVRVCEEDEKSLVLQVGNYLVYFKKDLLFGLVNNIKEKMFNLFKIN